MMVPDWAADGEVAVDGMVTEIHSWSWPFNGKDRVKLPTVGVVCWNSFEVPRPVTVLSSVPVHTPADGDPVYTDEFSTPPKVELVETTEIV